MFKKLTLQEKVAELGQKNKMLELFVNEIIDRVDLNECECCKCENQIQECKECIQESESVIKVTNKPIYIGQIGDIYRLNDGSFLIITCIDYKNEYMLLDTVTGRLLEERYNSIDDMYCDYEDSIVEIICSDDYSIVVD